MLLPPPELYTCLPCTITVGPVNDKKRRTRRTPSLPPSLPPPLLLPGLLEEEEAAAAAEERLIWDWGEGGREGGREGGVVSYLEVEIEVLGAQGGKALHVTLW